MARHPRLFAIITGLIILLIFSFFLSPSQSISVSDDVYLPEDWRQENPERVYQLPRTDRLIDV